MPIFSEMLKLNPDLALLIGDNIYGDTDDMSVLRDKYQTLRSNPHYSAFENRVPILATWDDHDFGCNDCDGSLKTKNISRTYIMDFLDEPVMIIKTAWGGHSLGIRFRPPSSGKPKYEKTSYRDEDLGSSYREMVRIVKDLCKDPGSRFPELEGREVEIAGFGWHQGWNDAGSREMVDEYAANMANLIRDLRKDLGVKDLPVVIANTGMIGMEATGIRAELCEIQLKMADEKVMPEFAGTIAAIETRPFARPANQSPSGFGYHWNHNAESHFLLGDAMGAAMVELLKK